MMNKFRERWAFKHRCDKCDKSARSNGTDLLSQLGSRTKEFLLLSGRFHLQVKSKCTCILFLWFLRFHLQWNYFPHSHSVPKIESRCTCILFIWFPRVALGRKLFSTYNTCIIAGATMNLIPQDSARTPKTEDQAYQENRRDPHPQVVLGWRSWWWVAGRRPLFGQCPSRGGTNLKGASLSENLTSRAQMWVVILAKAATRESAGTPSVSPWELSPVESLSSGIGC